MPDLDGVPIYKEHRELARVILGILPHSEIDLMEWPRGQDALRVARHILGSGYEKIRPVKHGTETFTRDESEILLGWMNKALEGDTRNLAWDSETFAGTLHGKIWDIWADLHPEEGPFK